MKQLEFENSVYRTKPKKISLFSKLFPSLTFYSDFLAIVFKSSKLAKKGEYDNEAWVEASYKVLRALEKKGAIFEITGIEHLQKLDSPCVIIGNHMSMMETIVMASIVQPILDVTFIVKQGLLDYPVFKYIMRSRDPIAVTRTNPRQDLKAVLEGGLERIQKGISIIVFPQTTRTTNFDPKQFSTIGVKLAQKADVPIIPLALKTDAWGNGKWLKDFGKIDPTKKVKFAFGAPIPAKQKGSEAHEAVKDFIISKLKEWEKE
ncbi:1-acyl-sn-glycerol-3-phosphate acyltransferase [candidate division KSB1 bacterium 4484_87]|nr:MAG: 1-acyl-sn-glycerol-3-phosphate acyltransferase [candidate division KSB1 bacterium 4484_87]